MNYYKHELSDVKSTKIGSDTKVWQFAIILEGAVIGENCNINCHTFIENDVIIGNNVTIKSGVYLWDGIKIEDNVFVGANAAFINDKYPRSKKYPAKFSEILVKKGSSIGANATILGGIVIGSYAIVGAGAVVTKDIPNFALVYGNPAQIKGWVNESGEILTQKSENIYFDKAGNLYTVENSKLLKMK